VPTARQRATASCTMFFPDNFFAIRFLKPGDKSEPVHFMFVVFRDWESLSTATAVLEKAVMKQWSRATVQRPAVDK
jgi:hypothetical protein